MFGLVPVPLIPSILSILSKNPPPLPYNHSFLSNVRYWIASFIWWPLKGAEPETLSPLASAHAPQAREKRP
jgi:hypothetical protein